MLPVLQAQDQLRQVSAMQLGSGALKKSAAARVRRDLARQARVPGRSKPARPEQLASRGVAVHAVARPSWASRYQ